jgi:arylsulfatase A-like enzyme
MAGGRNDGTEPYAGFEGRVGRTFAGSQSWWPTPPTPPENAPNVLLVMCDDLGFSDLGCYGSEIATPNLDRLADEGLRYTDFHVTPMCSPTRASLLTGLNSHMAGVGHVAHSDPGFPGYEMELAENAVTAAEIFRDNGYATMMFGKWHLTKDSHCSAAGPKNSWPCQRGFESFYGILDGFTNLHHPHRLVHDNHLVEVDRYPDDYFFTDDITERAISSIREVKASNPDKPFFCYFAHGAVHAPLHAKAESIARQLGRYDIGWDDLRSLRHSRAIELGLIPAGTALPPRNAEPAHDVAAWNDLDPRQQELFARYMEVYAAMVEEIDASFGQLRTSLEELGEWDDTLVLFTSDNGASREGEVNGTSSYYTHLIGEDDWEADYERLDLIGGPRTTPHYPRGWAMACNTPFRLYKINTHAGGHQAPLLVSWPNRGLASGEMRRQFVHVTDLLPTLIDLIGLDVPTQRHGQALKEMAGTSFGHTFDDADVETAHPEQYFEMWGHKGFRRGDWEAVTLHQQLTPFGDHEWELYDLASDPTETTDLAQDQPAKVAELAAAWEEAAWANQVYPLEEGTYLKHVIRPPWDDVWRRPVAIRPETPTLERWRSLQLIWVRSFTVEVDITLAEGDTGYLVAHGDQGGGYGLYMEQDELWWVHNDGRRTRRFSSGLIDPGSHAVTADVRAPGDNIWEVALRVDGEERATETGFPLFLSMAPFEGISVGTDRRSPLDWEIYQRHGPFPFTGDMGVVRYQPGDHAPDAPQNMIEVLREIGMKFE